MKSIDLGLSLPLNSDNQSELSLLTVEDVARFLQLTPATVRSMARRGDLTGVRLGRVWRFDRRTLENDIQRFRNLKGEPPVQASHEA